MARQRLVKPEFFQHEELHRAELVSALPLRVAYIGLWCQADRRGLFAWKPGRLKLNILPFDTVDFSAVLDALETAGFVRSYVVDGQRFGCIPAFAKHQSFHVRELADKTIPDPPDIGEAQEQHSASTVPTPDETGASTPVTVTVTGTDTVTVADTTGRTAPPAAETPTDLFWKDARVDAFMRYLTNDGKREAWRAILSLWRQGEQWGGGKKPTDGDIAAGLSAAMTASADTPLSERFVAACIRKHMQGTGEKNATAVSDVLRSMLSAQAKGAA